jgi:hypothetical protein
MGGEGVDRMSREDRDTMIGEKTVGEERRGNSAWDSHCPGTLAALACPSCTWACFAFRLAILTREVIGSSRGGNGICNVLTRTWPVGGIKNLGMLRLLVFKSLAGKKRV